MTSHPVEKPVVREESTDGWRGSSAGCLDDRSALLSILTADKPGDDDLEFYENYGSHPSKLPSRAGFRAMDMLASSQDFFDRLVTFPRWNIAFAAFALHGFYVHRDDAAEALERLMPHQATNPLVANVMASAAWLNTIGQGTGSIDPGVIMAAFPQEMASPPLIRLLWAARTKVGDDLVRIRAEVEDGMQKLDEKKRADRSAITSLYVLAAAKGLLDGAKTETAADNIFEALQHGSAELKPSSSAWTWTPPSPQTLKRWIKYARTELILLEKQLAGRPKAPLRRAKPRAKTGQSGV